MAVSVQNESLNTAIEKAIYFNTRIEGIFTGMNDILNNSQFDASKQVELLRAKASDLQVALMENNSAMDVLVSFVQENKS